MVPVISISFGNCKGADYKQAVKGIADSFYKYLFHRTNYGQVLGKMLNNKVDTAYQMLISEEDFVIPGYVEEAIEWLNE